MSLPGWGQKGEHVRAGVSVCLRQVSLWKYHRVYNLNERMKAGIQIPVGR